MTEKNKIYTLKIKPKNNKTKLNLINFSLSKKAKHLNLYKYKNI